MKKYRIKIIEKNNGELKYVPQHKDSFDFKEILLILFGMMLPPFGLVVLISCFIEKRWKSCVICDDYKKAEKFIDELKIKHKETEEKEEAVRIKIKMSKTKKISYINIEP